MGVLDKIKNALFEVEYVEVEEPPKKEKKPKVKNKDKKEKKEIKENKPIAKKIVLPGKREEKVEKLQEEELKDDNFEVRPKDEKIKEEKHDEFKFMDDKDFEVEEPEIVHVLEEETKNEVPKPEVVNDVPKYTSYDVTVEETIDSPVESNYSKPSYHSSRPYGMDNSYKLPVHEYGTYEKKEEKTYFKPSPIISPIYGILDKNYKKEDVREKREVRISSYSRGNLNVDDIRNKAYGPNSHEEKEVLNDNLEVEEEEENLLVDLSDRTKPEVKELTMGDALEYFQDLGLEYNVDYVDVSKERDSSKNKNTEKGKKVVDSSQNRVEEKELKGKHEEKTTKVVEVKDESSKQSVSPLDDDNDNLFDLIDSMYQEND